MEKDRINTEGRTLAQSIGNRPAEEKTVFRLMESVVSAAARLHQAGGYYGNIGPGSIVIHDKVWMCHTLPLHQPGWEKGEKGANGVETAPPAVSLLYRNRPKDDSEMFCIPVEEYLGGEMPGPWSDVYSICAVIYSMLTGRRPADVKARMRGERLEMPSRLGVSIGANRERALMKGLEIIQKDRWQNSQELYQALFEEENDSVTVLAEETGKVKKNKNVLMRQKRNCRMLGTDIWCSEILSVSFLDTLAGKPHRFWDVSDQKNGSVLAWAQEKNDGYDFYIAGEGGVAGNPDSSSLFQGCYRMRSVKFGKYFDTSRITDMCGMFDGCVSLTELDLSGFDTAAVTDMTSMFYNCRKLAWLDASGFSMKQVRRTSGMFTGCHALKGAAVKGIDLEKIKKGY